MKVIEGVPPNYDKIKEKMNPPARAIFCYGGTIYAPVGADITPELHAHEQVHCTRQGEDIEGWWDQYLVDPQFRFDEELLAHKAEYAAYLAGRNPNRASRRRVLKVIAKRLSGPLYGRVVTFDKAVRLVKGDKP